MKCKMLLLLAFVPVQSITRAFEEIAVDLPEELQGLYDYFEDTWLRVLKECFVESMK